LYTDTRQPPHKELTDREQKIVEEGGFAKPIQKFKELTAVGKDSH
jgi:hypothetical protein